MGHSNDADSAKAVDRSVEPEPDPAYEPEHGGPARRPDERPDKSADELELGWGERPHVPADEDDERLLRERPPHWE